MKKNSEKTSKKILRLAIIILFLVLVGLLLMQFCPLEEIFKKASVETVIIEDKCSLILGSVIHQIKDDASCFIMCKNECAVRGKNIKDHRFSSLNESCNSCLCNCD